MKVKILKNKKTGDCIINYFDDFDSGQYRFNILKRIVEGEKDLTLIIDTNQCSIEDQVEKASSYLNKSNLEFKCYDIKTNKNKFFGFNVRFKRRLTEKLIIIRLDSSRFTKELYDIFKSCDITLGINCKIPFEDLCIALIQNMDGTIFNDSYFGGSIYDSVLCRSLRCRYDRKNVEDIIHEMGI